MMLDAFQLKSRLFQKRGKKDPNLSPRSTFGRYVLAILVTAVATQLRLLSDPILGSRQPFATYFAAVVFITWYGGWGPSLLTLALGWLLADYYFIGERGVLFRETPLDWVSGGLYWFIGLTIVFLGRKLSVAKSSAEASAQRAQEREDRLRLAIAATGLGTWDFSPTSGKLELSEQCKKILGLDPDLPVGYGEVLNRVHPEDRPLIERGLREIESIPATEAQRFEFRVVWPDGTVRQLVADGKLFKSEARITRCIGTLLDITEQRRFETELVEQTEELKHKTRELTHTNEELEQFARLVAHDLRTPLVTLSLNAGLLNHLYGGKLDSDADEILDCIMQHANRMSRMISGLQNYSHLDSVPAGRNSFDSEAALQQALSDLSGAIEDSHAHITHGPLPCVTGDQVQFAELLRNLIENAIKFRRDIPLEIEISARMNGRETCFAVRDNGIGIQSQNYEKIFQIFQRLNKEDGKNTGLGLGLAMCKKIVERYGGKIWVESEPDQGSTFYFNFPNPLAESEMRLSADTSR